MNFLRIALLFSFISLSGMKPNHPYFNRYYHRRVLSHPRIQQIKNEHRLDVYTNHDLMILSFNGIRSIQVLEQTKNIRPLYKNKPLINVATSK